MLRAIQEEKAGLERSDPTVDVFAQRKALDRSKLEQQQKSFDANTNELMDQAKKDAQIAAAAAKRKKLKMLQADSKRNAVRKQKRNMFVFTEADSEEEEREERERVEKKKEQKQKVAQKGADGFEYYEDSRESSSSDVDSDSEEEPVLLNTVPQKSTNTAESEEDAMDVDDDAAARKPRLSAKDIQVETVKPTAIAVQGGGFSIPLFNTTNSDAKSKRSKPTTTLTKALQANPFSAATPKTIVEEEPKATGAPTIDPEIKKQLDQLHEAKVAALNSKKHLSTPIPASKRHPAYYVIVDRTEEIQQQRSELPITMEEQQIVEKILENDTVIICGETGSGKTTQLPQFLYEAGFGDPKSRNPGMIGVTEPRRVAAVSTAQRVAVELNQRPPALDEETSSGKVQMRTFNLIPIFMIFLTDLYLQLEAATIQGRGQAHRARFVSDSLRLHGESRDAHQVYDGWYLVEGDPKRLFVVALQLNHHRRGSRANDEH